MTYQRSSILLLRAAALFVFFTFLNSCNSDRSKSEGQGQASKSSYADEISIRYAKGFTITYHDHFKILQLISASPKADTSTYLLVDRGTRQPAGFSNAQVIEIPVRSLVATSSTHIGFLSFLNAEKTLTGLASLQYVYSPKVEQMIRAGKIAEIGKDQGVNQEKLVEMHPDLLMTSAGTGGIGQYQILRQAGIPVLPNSEWMEDTPLARAEWVKVLAVLLNEEKLANEKFASLEKEYKSLVSRAKKAKERPSIISGLNTKDAWFLPGGQSYMARFFEDAAGNYPWNHTKNNGSLSLSFEAVYPTALRADFWLNVGFDKNDTRQSVLATDARYADFHAFETGNMYSYNHRVNARGSNDFFESGTVAPQRVLADLIHILHPELLPAHELYFYKKLP